MFTNVISRETRTNSVTGEKEVWCLTETYGTSTDVKPMTNVVGGSVFVETDHTDGIHLYMYDEATSSWIAQ